MILEGTDCSCLLTLTWSVMLQMVMAVSLARRKSSVTFSPSATEQSVSKLLRTTSLSALFDADIFRDKYIKKKKLKKNKKNISPVSKLSHDYAKRSIYALHYSSCCVLALPEFGCCPDNMCRRMGEENHKI